MHVSSKEVDKNGVHIVTDLLEADGPFELVSKDGKLTARVISVARTDSGGISLQTAVEITEPVPVSTTAPSADDQAVAYLVSKGQKKDDAVANVGKFGAARILSAKSQEDANAQKKLDAELAALLPK